MSVSVKVCMCVCTHTFPLSVTRAYSLEEHINHLQYELFALYMWLFLERPYSLFWAEMKSFWLCVVSEYFRRPAEVHWQGRSCARGRCPGNPPP